MQLKQLFDDDRAVSPVIGVILMVAITVILAAVIGAFVLGLGDQLQSTSPQASMEFAYTQDEFGQNDTLEVAHGGGDTLDRSTINVVVSNAPIANGTYEWGDLKDSRSGDITAGSTGVVNRTELNGVNGNFATGTALDLNEATVRVVYEGESGDNSAVIGKWSGPDA